jgi:hypothetical protein
VKHLTLFALLVVGSALACFHDSGDPSMNNDAVIAQLGLRLPVGTRVVGSSASSERDGQIRAKLEMPVAQVAGFIANANIQGLEEADPDLLGPDEGFWDPHRAKVLQYGQTALPGARFLHVAIDESRPQTAVVYVMMHGT